MTDADTIMEASYEGNAVEIRRLLISNPCLANIRGWYNRTPLMTAAARGHVAVCRVLLKYGARTDDLAIIGGTALHHAARFGHEEVVSLLLEAKANAGMRGPGGWTALIAASAYGRLDVVKRLLAHEGQDVNEKTAAGKTALWLACSWGHADVAEALLMAGADEDMPDEEGQTPRTAAEQWGKHGCLDVLQVRPSQQKILTYSISLEWSNKGKSTETISPSYPSHFHICKGSLCTCTVVWKGTGAFVPCGPC